MKLWKNVERRNVGRFEGREDSRRVGKVRGSGLVHAGLSGGAVEIDKSGVLIREWLCQFANAVEPTSRR